MLITKGKGILMLHPEDYKTYLDNVKNQIPAEVKSAIDYIRECEKDIGFMGSPKYYEAKKVVENHYDKK